MIGHADAQYFYFGKTAARIEDVANYLPARISAFAIIAGAHLTPYADPKAAWKTWQRDGCKYKSPNAGQPESAMAGALHVHLGGNNIYSGELIAGERIGALFPPPTVAYATRALRLVSTASLLGLALGVLLTFFQRTEKQN